MRFAFGCAVVTLLVVGTTSFRLSILSNESDQWVRHTYEVIENLKDSSTAMVGIDSNCRGFALTGVQSYLDSCYANREKVGQRLTILRNLTADNPAQQRRFPALEALFAEKVQRTDGGIHVRQSQGLDGAAGRFGSGEGQRITDAFQALADQMEAEERRLLALRVKKAERLLKQTKLTLALEAVIGLLITGAAGWNSLKMNEEYEARSRAEVETRARNEIKRVEERRHDAEQQWRIFNLTLSTIIDYAYTFDSQGRFLYVSQSLLDLWGVTLEETVGKNFFEMPYPYEEAARYHGQVMEVFATGKRLSGVAEYTSRTGSVGYYEYFFCPIVDLDGSVELVSGASIDITARRAAAAHLEQMEARYRGLLEAAPDAMVVVNQAGEIVLANLQAGRQFGYDRFELIGQQVTDIVPEENAELLIAQGTLATAVALAHQAGSRYERIGLCKDGSEFPVEIVVSAFEGDEGMMVTAAIRDISARRAAEEHLVRMEAKYRGLLEAAPDAMVVVNQAGEMVLANVQAGRQFGYDRDELVGQRVMNIIPAGFAERLIADALRSSEDAMAQQIGMGIELTGLRKDGSEFPIEIMLSPLETVDGAQVTVAIHDITRRKEAETQLHKKLEELSRSNGDLEQFAYVASHDLQEPLRMVASFTQLLSRQYKGRLDSDADEYIAFAVDGANRMQRLIHDLLAYSRVGTERAQVLDASGEEALERALINLRGIIEESGAVVTHDMLPRVLVNETQMVLLFQNLVGNAIKYQGPGKPLIHISAARSGGAMWMFSVQDNGLGIEPQYFEKIFGMFQRLHKREQFSGTGIGLAICKRIVDRHGGTISVASKPGHGSTFFFTLPGKTETKWNGGGL